MQSFVSLVNKDNYQSFVERDPTKYKVLLFTERKSTAPIFKALSKQFKDKLLFGEVRKSSDSDLIQKFHITQFPTMLVITEPHSHEGEKYEGELKIDRLTKFLNQYSYKQATYEKKLEFSQLTA
jgi:protein disulfide-isomerase A6